MTNMGETTQIEKLNHFLEDMNYRYDSFENMDLPIKNLGVDERIASVAVSCIQKNLITSSSFEQIGMYASMSQEGKANSIVIGYEKQMKKGPVKTL